MAAAISRDKKLVVRMCVGIVVDSVPSLPGAVAPCSGRALESRPPR
jgi:hypothetical protein